MSIEHGLADYQKISLEDVDVEIKLGCADWEKGKPQKVLIDVDLYTFKGKFDGKSLKDCVDYERPFLYITKTWPKRKHVILFEDIAEDLVAFCLKDKLVDAVRVRIRKPHVYNGRGTPAVEFFRIRDKSKRSEK